MDLTALEEAIAHQRTKVAALGRRLNPRLTADDLMSPADFPELRDDPQFNYEDGILSGLLAAKTILLSGRPPASRG